MKILPFIFSFLFLVSCIGSTTVVDDEPTKINVKIPPEMPLCKENTQKARQKA